MRLVKTRRLAAMQKQQRAKAGMTGGSGNEASRYDVLEERVGVFLQWSS